MNGAMTFLRGEPRRDEAEPAKAALPVSCARSERDTQAPNPSILETETF